MGGNRERREASGAQHKSADDEGQDERDGKAEGEHAGGRTTGAG